MLNYLFVFSLSACDIYNEPPVRIQISDFSGCLKMLKISRLIFVDTFWGPKTGLKEPK